MGELIAGAEGIGPWFLALLLLLGFSVYALEKLGGKEGPITRALAWFSNRELNQLRRQAELEAERKRLAELVEGRAVARLRKRLAEAYDEIDELESIVDWLLRDRNDQRRRDRERGRFDAELVKWFDLVIRAVADAAPGMRLPAPPRPPEGLADLLVMNEDLPDDAPPIRKPGTRRRREILEEEWDEEDVAEAAAHRDAAARGGRRASDRRAAPAEPRGGR